jgi:hypothetical protein
MIGVKRSIWVLLLLLECIGFLESNALAHYLHGVYDTSANLYSIKATVASCYALFFKHHFGVRVNFLLDNFLQVK